MKLLFTKRSILLLVATAICKLCSAQEVSFVPPVFNYTTHNYRAGNQNWAVAQGRDRVIYVGNEHGLLSFDGVNWQLNPLPNHLSVKSLFIDHTSPEERIYVGSFEEFGYFQKNGKNELCYHSLKPLIREFTLYNDEVWTIHKLGSKLFFQTFSSYFVYDESDNTLKTEKPFPAPLYFFKAGEELYAQFIDDHFYRYDGKQFQLLLTRERLNNDHVVSVLLFNNILLLTTERSGIFSLDPATGELIRLATEVDRELQSETVNRVTRLSDSVMVIGTLKHGLYALRTDGTLLWQLNRNNGLYNNTILGLFTDDDSNLWAALDNGISHIRTHSPLSFFEPKNIHIGMVEDILIRQEELYLATNQGIYTYDNQRQGMSQLPDFNIQSWFIREFDNQIITGNNSGTAFVVNNRKKELPETGTGGTDIRAMRVHNREILLESTYTSLQVYLRNSSGQWSYSHKVEDFFDLINQVELDHAGNIWAGHMYKGVYRLRLDEALRKVVQQEFFTRLDSTAEATRPIRTMKLMGRMVFTDGAAFYTYDDIAQQIVPFGILNRELPQLTDTRSIVSINDTAFWFLRPEEYTLVKFSGGEYRIADRIPFAILNNPPNAGRGNIFVKEHRLSYFCLNGGIGRYDHSYRPRSNPPRLELYRIESYNRNSDTIRLLPVNGRNVIGFSENNLAFTFRYPDFSYKRFTVECFLESYDNRWRTTSTDLTITYPNLPANTYQLHARVLNDMGEVLSTLNVDFEIRNPWYKSTFALLVYFVMVGLLIAFLIREYIRMVIRRKNKLFAQQEKERLAQLDRQEKLIAEMKSEKLRNELIYKSKELASATLMVINHQELLNQLKKEILEHVRSGKFSRAGGISLIKMIDSNLPDEDEWAIFQENFDLIHESFFRKLTERYPELTPGDLRLCALLRLNYTSKEIAKMLNLTLRGVEAARYRLRKKLNLEEEENLVSFMINFT